MKIIILHHLTNHLLKCAALMLSILCWLHINYNKEICCTIKIPLLFDHITDTHILSAPETISLQIQGTRTALLHIDNSVSAVHIDARTLKKGDQILTVSSDAIFLPESVSVLHYSPCTISVK
jgi:hypothetical protein